MTPICSKTTSNTHSHTQKERQIWKNMRLSKLKSWDMRLLENISAKNVRHLTSNVKIELNMIYELNDEKQLKFSKRSCILKMRKKYRWPVTLTLLWGIRFILSLPFLLLSLRADRHDLEQIRCVWLRKTHLAAESNGRIGVPHDLH